MELIAWDVTSSMGMVQVTASSKSFCLVPKYLMIEDLSTLAAAAMPRMLARS